MNMQEILSKCDHTLLSQTATWAEIQAICDDGMRYGKMCIRDSIYSMMNLHKIRISV